jgi:hypothetical protein
MRTKGVLKAPLCALVIAAAGAIFMAMPATVSSAADDTKLNVIAKVGDTVPTPGSPTITELDEPMVDNAGNVVFVGFLSNGQQGLFYRKRGSAKVKAIASSDVAITGVGTGGEFDGPVMSRNGKIGFVVREATGDVSAVIRKRKGNKLEILALTGDTAPGTGGAVFSDFDDLAINTKGQIAFIATYTSDGDITTKTGVFLFVSKKKGIIPIVLNGDALPGTGGTEDGTDEQDIDGPWLNDKGDVAFEPDVINAASGFEGSLFLKQNGKPLEAFILVGDAIPSPVGGTVAEVHIGRPALSNNDTIAFTIPVIGGTVENVTGTKQAGGSIQICAPENAAAPDTVGTISGASAASLAGNTLLFHADILGDLSTSGGLFTCAKKFSQLREAVLTSDTNPAGTWGEVPEEESLSNNWTVFQSDGGTPVAVLLTKLPGKEPKNDKN